MHATRYSNVPTNENVPSDVVWQARGVIATIVLSLAGIILGMLFWFDGRLETIRLDLGRDVEIIDNRLEQRMNNISSDYMQTMRDISKTVEWTAAQAHIHTYTIP